MPTNFKVLSENMNIQLDYICNYLDTFLNNLGNNSEKQREKAVPLRSKNNERKLSRLMGSFRLILKKRLSTGKL